MTAEFLEEQMEINIKWSSRLSLNPLRWIRSEILSGKKIKSDLQSDVIDISVQREQVFLFNED